MNKFLVRYYLVFLTTFSFSVFSLKGKTESSKSDVVSKDLKKVRKERVRLLRK